LKFHNNNHLLHQVQLNRQVQQLINPNHLAINKKLPNNLIVIMKDLKVNVSSI